MQNGADLRWNGVAARRSAIYFRFFLFCGLTKYFDSETIHYGEIIRGVGDEGVHLQGEVFIIMENKQLLQFLKGKLLENPTDTSGPVVTISREYGCPGYEFAEKLSAILSTKMEIDGKRYEWRAIGREIVEEAARTIQLPPNLVEAITKSRPKGVFSEFLESLSSYQKPCDIEVKKMVANFVMAAARQGHVVIVGRGGSILTSNMTNALHIGLNAPLPWRIKRVMEIKKCDQTTAEGLIELVDRERTYLRHFLAGESVDTHIFDICFNMEHLTVDMAVELVLVALQQKKIIRPDLIL